jgi:hypothetical protein
MIHHISISANDPLHVAQVLAELFQGEAVPFSGYPGSYIALMFDTNGTLIEVHPKGIELRPTPEQASHIYNPHASLYTATHAAISVPVSEIQIQAIANREGWRAKLCDREGYFEVIEFWIENQIMVELLPPSIAPQYLAFMQPQSLKQVLAAMASA